MKATREDTFLLALVRENSSLLPLSSGLLDKLQERAEDIGSHVSSGFFSSP